MKDLNQEFGIVYYKTAKLAREKGFLEHCDWQYAEYNNNKLINWKDECVKECIEYDIIYAYKAVERLAEDYNHKHIIRDDGYYLAAPTQTHLQKWLRKKHNIIVEVLIFDKGFLEIDKFCYQYRVYNNSMDWITGLEFKTYEETLEKGLQVGLKLIKCLI